MNRPRDLLVYACAVSVSMEETLVRRGIYGQKMHSRWKRLSLTRNAALNQRKWQSSCCQHFLGILLWIFALYFIILLLRSWEVCLFLPCLYPLTFQQVESAWAFWDRGWGRWADKIYDEFTFNKICIWFLLYKYLWRHYISTVPRYLFLFAFVLCLRFIIVMFYFHT